MCILHIGIFRKFMGISLQLDVIISGYSKEWHLKKIALIS